MLFRSGLVDAAWDTWMYYADGKYYLYYLITENSPGEGFGVAVSEDGVHYKDYGKQLGPSEKMVFYLGTGSVWKPLPEGKGYLCNYSEWRMHGDEKKQQIFFAYSDDLIHWEKFDELHSLEIDTRYYTDKEEQQARWDCINVLRTENGYIGYWTARPYVHAGIGFGKSADGLNWEALAPPDMDISVFGTREIESGSVTCHDGKYYMLVGCYSDPSDVVIMTADRPEGRFVPQAKSASIFANQECMHGYFARFFETPEGTMVNFHVLLREENEHRRAYTYLAPLKKVEYDAEGTLRLRWWEGNRNLIGKPAQGTESPCMACVTLKPGQPFGLRLQNGDICELTVTSQGRGELKRNGKSVAYMERALKLEGEIEVRLLLRGTMLEWYTEDWYQFCHTLPAEVAALECENSAIVYESLTFD